jgi:hypothetical protein
MNDDYEGYPGEGELFGPPPSDGPIEPGWWEFFAGTWQWVTSPKPTVGGT